MSQHCASAILIVASGAIASAAAGDERIWNQPLGGAYGDAANWDDGEGSVPGAEDIAIFDLAAPYSVHFDAIFASDQARVQAGVVTFVHGGGFFDLVSALPGSPGLVVAAVNGDVASLTLEGVPISADFVQVGQAPGSFGILELTEFASLEAVYHLIIGNEGAALLNLDGASIASPTATFGHASGGYGSGAMHSGAIWDCANQLTVGRAGAGALEIGPDVLVLAGELIVAQLHGALGDVVVSGVGTLVSINGATEVGLNGFGSLRLEDGSTVFTGGFAIIGAFPGPFPGNATEEGGHGEVHVLGGASWVIGGNLDVGFLGVGTLHVSGDSFVGVGANLVARDNGVIPQVLVTLAHHAVIAPIGAGGTASIDDLRVELGEGVVLEVGRVFPIVAAAAITVDSIELPEIAPALSWSVVGGNGAEVIDLVVRPACEGDFDLDGVAGFNDLTTLLTSWGACPGLPAPCPADVDGNRAVGFSDLTATLIGWGPCS